MTDRLSRFDSKKYSPLLTWPVSAIRFLRLVHAIVEYHWSRPKRSMTMQTQIRVPIYHSETLDYVVL